MDAGVERLRDNAVAPSSAKQRRLGWRHWERFAQSLSFDPLLVKSPSGSNRHAYNMVRAEQFVSYLLYTVKVRTGKTCATYLGHVSTGHRIRHLRNPFSGDRWQLRQTLAAANKLAPSGIRVMEPFSVALLRRLFGTAMFSPSLRWGRLMRTVSAVALYGVHRSQAYCVPAVKDYDCTAYLSVADVRFFDMDGAACSSLFIKKGKRDQNLEGREQLYTSDGGVTAPTPLLRAWLQNDRAGAAYDDPLFTTDRGKALTYKTYMVALKTACRQADIDETLYATHSFRSGSATALLASGVDHETIKQAGDWRGEGSVNIYTLPSMEPLLQVGSAIASATHTPLPRRRGRTQELFFPNSARKPSR